MTPTSISSVIIHIAAWILFLSQPVLFVTGQSGNTDSYSTLASPYASLSAVTTLF